MVPIVEPNDIYKNRLKHLNRHEVKILELPGADGKFFDVRNNTIATASFNTLSPKTKLYNKGCSRLFPTCCQRRYRVNC